MYAIIIEVADRQIDIWIQIDGYMDIDRYREIEIDEYMDIDRYRYREIEIEKERV